MTEVSIPYLFTIFSVDFVVGKLYWKVKKSKCVSIGDEAGYFSNGYRRVKFDGYSTGVHRIIFAMYHKYWASELDHINKQRADNRIINLRDVSRAENMHNLSKRKDNTSGVTGVGWLRRNRKWYACIMVHSNKIFLGTFDDKFDAICARKSAEVRYGFTNT